jgi:hypothetical protein
MVAGGGPIAAAGATLGLAFGVRNRTTCEMNLMPSRTRRTIAALVSVVAFSAAGRAQFDYTIDGGQVTITKIHRSWRSGDCA